MREIIFIELYIIHIVYIPPLEFYCIKHLNEKLQVDKIQSQL